ncbi:CAP domain-containing protein [Clostridium sp.]|uniref:CAP domain-containing protein n=1 Tax=Clostridium sp. TaxID=1506 RepID=UPI0026104E47|nr:CAP domain-containing protein [Clostridium sp.]
MIKSRIIMLLVSCALTASVGVGGYFIPKLQKSQNSINIDDSNKDKENATNIDKENNKDDIKVNDEDNIKTDNPSNIENSEPENRESNTNNKVENKGNQFADNKIDEDIFESGNRAPSNEKSDEGKEDSIIGQVPVVEDSSDAYIAQIEQDIFQRVNKERTANGLASLTYNVTMEYYSRYKSKDMADNDYFDHNDLKGELITAKMKRDGVSYNAWGENIAYIQGGYDNVVLATKFMDNWMNSSGHRANILSSNFSSIGVGVYKVGSTYYATQEFYK